MEIDKRDVAMIETLKESMMSWMTIRANKVSKNYLSYVIPISGDDESTDPVPTAIGTGILIDFDGDKYLITAAHVADHQKNTRLLMGVSNRMIPISKAFICTDPPHGERAKDRLDFAFMRLDNEMLSQMPCAQFLGKDQISENRADPTKRSYLAMGYPISRNKKVNATQRKVYSEAWHYQSNGFIPDDKTLDKIDCDIDHHLFIRMTKKVGNYKGDRVDSGSPKGASGGALIDMGVPHPETFHPDAPVVGRLAGLFIERKQDEKLLVFVRIQLILNAIQLSRNDGR
ncbi:hypothetical protein [Comamonas sp. 23]|uniref:hypothetical protein n=1 Tax=Comamonas sp. 23 TaxID=3415008 RepID=UPI003C6F6476